MCGISGMVSRVQQVDRASLRRMHAAIAHRGPDGEGEFFDQHLGMMHRRLSIIDLQGGGQPLYDENRSLALIANGEIYNHVELRKELQAQGHRFSTRSDCEVILHLYQQYGTACVDHLRGMFAFALWDAPRRRLLLARDRMGEKPLYLYQTGDTLLFCSELRGILASGQVPVELDPTAVNSYFHYCYVPEPATPITNVIKLDAGQWLTLDVDTWRVQKQTYWRMTNAPALQGDPAERIRDQLETVSKLVIRSDVPVGVALSGGLDSSLIAALAARDYPGTLQAFTVGYPGRPAYDERRQAKSLADHLGIPIHEIELTAEAMAAGFPETVARRDDPIANIASFGLDAVMRRARQAGVPVLLLGQGGDELFWGYDWVRRCVQENQQKQRCGRPGLRSLPHYLNPLNNGLAAKKLSSLSRVQRAVLAGWKRFKIDRASDPTQLVFYDRTPDFQQASREARHLFTASFHEQVRQSAQQIFQFAQPWPQIDICLTQLICDTYLRQDGIAHADRLSMASSIEVRLPLVDHRLVETVIGLRKSQRDDHLEPKAHLRAAVGDLLPDWVMNRQKRGFQPPLQQWYRAMFDRYGESLRGGFLVESNILTPESASRLSHGPSPRGNVHPLSFKALVLETWCRGLAETQVARRAA